MILRNVILLSIVAALALSAGEEGVPDAALKAAKELSVVMGIDNGFGGIHSGMYFKKVMKKEGRVAPLKDVEFGYYVTDIPKNKNPEDRPNPIGSVSFHNGKQVLTRYVKTSAVDDEHGIVFLFSEMHQPGNKNVEWVQLGDLKPVSPMPLQKIQAGAQVYALGYTSVNGGTTLSVIPAKVLQIDHGDFGPQVQIEGDFSVAGTGGVVIDAKGNVLGMCLGVRDDTTHASILSMAAIDELSRGGIGKIQIREIERKNGIVSLGVTAHCVQPEIKLTAIGIMLVSKDRIKAEPKIGPQNLWAALPGPALEQPLQIDTNARGTGTVRAKLDDYYYQIKYLRGDGSVRYTRPALLTLLQPEVNEVKARGKQPDKDDDWLTGKPPKAAANAPGNVPEVPKEIPLGDVPKPQETGASLVERVVTEPDIEFKVLKLNGASFSSSRGESGMPNKVSEDGKHLYLMEVSGVLRRITLPEFKEELKLEFNKTCKSISMSSEGLLALISEVQELWIIDPQTLAVKKRIMIPEKASYVCSAATLPVAFVVSDDRIGTAGKSIVSVDLKTGAVETAAFSTLMAASKIPPKALKDGEHADERFRNPVVTPDGRYLVCNDTHLLRFKINKTSLTLEEIGASTSMLPRLQMAPDSKRIVVEAGAELNFYATDRLQIPDRSVEVGDFDKYMLFAGNSDQIIGNKSSRIQWINNSGQIVKDYPTPAKSPVTRVIALPGDKLLVFTDGLIMTVELRGK